MSHFAGNLRRLAVSERNIGGQQGIPPLLNPRLRYVDPVQLSTGEPG